MSRRNNAVCKHWKMGNCRYNKDCSFRHSDLPLHNNANSVECPAGLPRCKNRENCYHKKFTEEDRKRLEGKISSNIELHFESVEDITGKKISFSDSHLSHTIIDRQFKEKNSLFHCKTFFLEKRTDSEHFNSKCSDCAEFQSNKNIFCNCGGKNKYDCQQKPPSGNHGLDRISKQYKGSINLKPSIEKIKDETEGNIHLIDMLGHLSTALILVKIPNDEIKNAQEHIEKICQKNRGREYKSKEGKCDCDVDIKYLRAKHAFLIPLTSLAGKGGDTTVALKYPCCNQTDDFVVYGRERPVFTATFMESYFGFLDKNGLLDDTYVLFTTENNKMELTFPGGQMERNETPMETLIREVSEEIGVILNEKFLQFVYASCEINRVLFLHCFYFSDFSLLLSSDFEEVTTTFQNLSIGTNDLPN